MINASGFLLNVLRREVQMLRILFVEGQTSVRSLVEHRLDGFLVDSGATLEVALAKHNVNPFDIVIWNSQSAPSKCSKLSRTVKQFSKNCVDTKTIVIADPGNREVASTRNLRCEWLSRPVSESELMALIEAAIHFKELNHVRPSSELVVPVEFEGMVAFTLTMQFVIQHIMEAAASDIPVLIAGETGEMPWQFWGSGWIPQVSALGGVLILFVVIVVAGVRLALSPMGEIGSAT